MRVVDMRGQSVCFDLTFSFLSVALLFELGTWFLCMTLPLMLANICVRFNLNPFMRVGDVLRTKCVL